MQKSPIKYIHLAPENDLPVLEGATPFKAIVMVEAQVPEMTQWDVSRWLVASGCKYALVWGEQCEAWRESIDDASLEATDYEDVPDDQQVMATAHDDEDVSEVFWFAKHRASHPALDLNETLILHIADAPRRDEVEAEYRDA